MARVWIGGAIWCVLLLVGWWGFGSAAAEKGLIQQLARHGFRSRLELTVRVEPAQALQVGDPIYLQSPDSDEHKLVGRVLRVGHATSRERGLVVTEYAVLGFYPSAPVLSPLDELSLVNTPQSLGWVIETMLPPEMRRRIGEIIVGAWAEHREMLLAELQPFVLSALRESTRIIQEDLAAAWARQRVAIDSIADRYRDEYLLQQVLPVFQRDVWPIIRQEMQPLLEQIGMRLWERASLFRITWRYLYDLSPLPQRDLLRREFERFVEQDAAPVLLESMPLVMQAQQRILIVSANHPNVQEVVAKGLQRLAQDSDVQQLVWGMLQETLVNNPRLADVWRSVWNTAEAKEALDRIGYQLEPSIVEIGELMFGNPNTEITSSFSRVLRNRVLLKDDRWLILQLADDPQRGQSMAPQTLVVRPGDRQLLDGFNPFHVPATPRN